MKLAPAFALISALATPLATCLAAPVAAQAMVDTVGGINSSASGSNLARGNLFRVDRSRVLTRIDAYLSQVVPPPRNLEYFVYRHHSRQGAGTLVHWNTAGFPVGEPGWRNSGDIWVPLVQGYDYAICVGWTGDATYSWTQAPASGTRVSWGEWLSGRTLTSPPPPTLSFAGTDIAQFPQMLTTIPLTGIDFVGTGCGGPVPPRLLASDQLIQLTTPQLEIADGVAGAPALIAFGHGSPLPTPLPILGCQVWLPNVIADVGLQLSQAGDAILPLPVPRNPALAGVHLTAQAVFVHGFAAFTNAIDLTLR